MEEYNAAISRVIDLREKPDGWSIVAVDDNLRQRP